MEASYDTVVWDKLEKFVARFVKEFETKLKIYHMVNEGEIQKAGRFSDRFSEKIGQGVGIAVGGLLGLVLTTPLKGANVGAELGKVAGKKVGENVGETQYRKRNANLLEIINLSQSEKPRFRKMLVDVGYDIFQSFELQFSRVTVGEGVQNDLYVLAEDAVNRAISYLRKNKDSTLGESVLLGKSKVMRLADVPVPGKHGYSVIYEYQSAELNWKTASMYEKSGIVIGTVASRKYYKKKNESSRTGKYGYRRLFKHENWKTLQTDYETDNIAESKSGQFTDYEYELSSSGSEERLQKLLDKLNEKDENLSEERIQKVLVEIKSEILEEVSGLKRQVSENDTENLSVLINIERNLEALNINYYLLKHLEEAAKDRKYIKDSIDIGFKKVEQLLKVHNSKDIKPIWFDVRETVNSFTERKDGWLKLIISDKKQNVVVISGLAGVGKSELALWHAHNQYSKEDNVLWINAETSGTMKDSFRRLLKEVGEKTTDSDGEEKSLELMAKEVYCKFADKTSLFIFDNAESFTAIEKSLPNNLKDSSQKLRVVITSCSMEWNSARLKIKPLVLNDFTEDESIKFITESLEMKNKDAEILSVVELARKLHYFPLALQQAVTYIETMSIEWRERGKDFSISDYLEKFDVAPKKLLNFKLPSDGHSATLSQTLQVVLDKISCDPVFGKQALDMLNVMAYLAPNNIPEDLFLCDWISAEEETLMSVIGLAKKYSVVRINEGKLTIHAMVQDMLRLKLEGEQVRGKSSEEETLTNALDLLKKLMVDRATAESYESHIISIWNYAKKYGNLISRFIVDCVDDNIMYTTYFHLIAGSNDYGILDTIVKNIEQNHRGELSKVINAKDKDKGVPLHNAARSGDARIAKLLVDKGADVNVKKGNDWTPLLVAAKNGHSGVVRILLKKDADTNAKTSQGNTSLHFAANSGNLEIVNALLNRTAFVSPKTYNNITPLHLAAGNGNVEIVSVLLRNKADIEAKTVKKFTPLHLAAQHGHSEVIEILLKDNASVNAKTENKFTALHFAAQDGHVKAIKALLKNTSKTDVGTSQDNISPQLVSVSLIIKTDIEAETKDKFTPLLLAVQHGHLEAIEILLTENANVNAETKSNFTALHFAAQKGHVEAIKTLLMKNPKLDVGTSQGKTPLHLAARKGCTEIVSVLLEKGASINMQDKENFTALHWAAVNGHVDVVNVLLNDSEINIEALTTMGKTPLNLAEVGNHTLVIKSIITKKNDGIGNNENTFASSVNV